MKLKTISVNALKKVDKYLPEILISAGVVGVVTTAVLACKNTIKAMDDIQEAKDKKYEECGDSKLTSKELVQSCAKDYIPTVISAGCTIACVTCAFSEEARRLTALTVGYQTALDVIKDKDAFTERLKTAIGEKKAKAVEEEYAIEKSKAMEENSKAEVAKNVNGETLFLFKDTVQNREFYSTVNAVKEAFTNFKARSMDDLMGDGFYYIDDCHDSNFVVPHNDLNGFLGIEYSELGHVLGFTRDELVALRPIIGADLDSNGVPCYALNYTVPTHLV